MAMKVPTHIQQATSFSVRELHMNDSHTAMHTIQLQPIPR